MKGPAATLILLTALHSAAQVTETASHRFTPIPGLGSSSIEDISADGLVVVGAIDSSLSADDAEGEAWGLCQLWSEPFRWSRQEGTVRLRNAFDEETVSNYCFYASEGWANATATAVSADGSFVVGHGEGEAHYDQYWLDMSTYNETERFAIGFRWPDTAPIYRSDWTIHPNNGPRMTAVSANGRTIAGNHSSRAMIWRLNEFEGVQEWLWKDLGTLRAYDDGATAEAISANGDVVVGHSGYRPFRWTPARGMEPLGEAGALGNALGVSADGQIAVGRLRVSTSSYVAVYWSADGEAHPLPLLPGGSTEGLACDASTDGALIVGRCATASGPEAVLWDDNRAIRCIREILEEGGVDLTGWTLTEAVAISDDGTVVVGNGRNPGGIEQGWVANLGASPIAPVITHLAPTADPGRFVLHYRASADDQITLQFSEDLRTWTDVESVPLSAGENVLNVSAPANTPEGYWRLVPQ